MNKGEKGFIIGLNIFLALLFLLCEWWVRPHFEENFALWKLWLYASDGYTQGFHHLNDVIIWQEILEFLYGYDSSVAWFPLFVLFFSFLSVIIIVNASLFLAKDKGLSLPMALALVLILLPLLMANWFWVHQNRVAFLMCGSAILATMAVYGSSNYHLKKWVFPGAVVWFVGGMFFRPEAALATLAILAPGYLIYFGGMLKKGLPPYLVFGSILFLFFGYFFLKILNSHDFYYRTEPDVEYEIVDRRNVVPVSAMKTREDSLRYMAVTHYWMLGDVQKSDPEFIRSLLNKPSGFFDRFLFFLRPSSGNEKQFVNASSWYELVLANRFVVYLYGIVLLLALFLVGWKRVMIIGGFWALSTLLLSFSFSINGYHRILEPMLALIGYMGVFILLVGISPAVSKKKHFILGVLLSAVAFGYIATQIYDAKQRSLRLSAAEAERKRRVEDVMEMSKRPLVWLHLEAAPLDTDDALVAFKGFGDKKLILSELVQCSANSGFLRQTTLMTGCEGTDFLCRIKYLKNHMHEIVIIATRERLKFYDDYMWGVYGLKTDFSTAYAIPLDGDVYFWLP